MVGKWSVMVGKLVGFRSIAIGKWLVVYTSLCIQPPTIPTKPNIKYVF